MVEKNVALDDGSSGQLIAPLIPLPQPPGLPPLALRAIEQIEALGQMLNRIDQAIVAVDEKLDALQPPAPGKIRLVFQKDRQTIRPRFVKYLRRRDGRWWGKRISVGWAVNSVRDTKDFEPNADLVRLYCREANVLLELRLKVNRILMHTTTAGLGAVPSMTKKLNVTRAALGLSDDPSTIDTDTGSNAAVTFPVDQ